MPNIRRSHSFIVRIASAFIVIASFTIVALAIDFSITDLFGLPTANGSPRTLGSNYPGTSIPLSTGTTVTPAFPPTNTTSINVATSTSFKGTLEGNPATGVVRITNAYPAGTYLVNVTAFGPGGTFSIESFTLTVMASVATCNPVSFATANYSTLNSPQSAAVGDFNADGNQDIAIANAGSSYVSILLGVGAGNFSAPVNFGTGSAPYSVAVGDFNGDDKQDLATANAGSNDVSILLGDGSGIFSTAVNFGVGNSPRSLAVGEFNGDGKQDLVTANNSSANFSILRGDGDGNFGIPMNIAANFFPLSVAIGDFNSDGKQDLVSAPPGASFVSVYLQNALGNFDPPANYGVGGFNVSALTVTVGDVNNDSIQDLVVGVQSGFGIISILFGVGNGSFGFGGLYGPAGSFPFISLGDFNGDGNQDIVGINPNSSPGIITILTSDGGGNFNALTTFVVGSNPLSSATGDFNGDGKQDLVVANSGSADVTVLLRRCTISGTVTYGNAVSGPTPPRFVSNVTISSTAGSPAASATTLAPGANVGTYLLSVFGTGPYTISPSKTGGQNGISSFDAAKIALHVAGTTSLTGNQLIVADTSGNSTISSFDAGLIANYVAGPTPPFGQTGMWKFLPANRTYPSVTSPIAGEDYVALLMGEISGNWTNTGARPAHSRQLAEAEGNGPERGVAVELPSVTASTDKEIVVPVKVQGIADKGVISYEFDLRYDPSVIKPLVQPVDVAGTASRGLSVVTNATEPGLLRVVIYGAYPIDGDGVLLNLRFTSVGSAGAISPLSFERIMFNEGDPGTLATDGQVRLSVAAPDRD